jgi:predicted transcriptional regulator
MKSNKIKLTKEQEHLIEKLGIVNEKGGIQPAAARIMSLLLVSDKTELTFEEIYETLNLSKSATSNGINLLLTTNKIEYTTKMGDRKRYFRSRVIFWQENLKQDLSQLYGLTELLSEVLKQRPATTAAFNKQLRGVIDFIEFLHSEIPAIYQKWERKKK